MSLTNKNPVGRPSKDQRNRERLIQAARKLFVAQDYAKVSIRKIAAEAGTDPGLIRYYFGSKADLFGTMMRETAEPVMQQKKAIERQASIDSAGELLTSYYRVMASHPEFPLLVYRTASLDDSAPDSARIKELFTHYLQPSELNLFHQLHGSGEMADDVDPELMRISFISLMIFPFLMPARMQAMLDIKLTPEFLARLAQHNSQLLGQFLQKDVTNDSE